MPVKVLKTEAQNRFARMALKKRGLDCTGFEMVRKLRRRGLWPGTTVGDVQKSWDVLETMDFINGHLAKTDAILDIGAFASEMLPLLHRLGYRNLTGVDLNPDILKMPYRNSIRYTVADMMKTPFPDGSFSAVTAISVIEHGFNLDQLLRELQRLLKSGGYFIASYDYWQNKIDVSDAVKPYGMDWVIFCEQEIRNLITRAGDFGFVPAGDDLDFNVQDAVINWMGQSYTFGWIALQKAV